MTPRRRTAISVIYVVVVAVAAVLALRGRFDDVAESIRELSIAPLMAAFGCSVAALALSMAAWRELLAGFGHRVPVGAATEIFFLSQLGKYLPGSVWPAVAQVELGLTHSVPRRPNGWSFALAMLLSLFSAVVIAGAAALAVGYTTLPLLGAAGLVVITLAARQIGTERIERIPVLGRLRPERWPTASSMRRAFALFATHWVVHGAHLALLLSALDVDLDRPFRSSVMAFGLAFVAGTLLVIAPAGLGVREGVLIAILGPLGASAAAATTASLVSRLLLTAADLAAGALAAALAVTQSRWSPRTVRRR